jgi:hypothetical protein
MKHGLWAIMQCTEVFDNGYKLSPVGEHYCERKDARRRIYELNGWKYNG